MNNKPQSLWDPDREPNKKLRPPNTSPTKVYEEGKAATKSSNYQQKFQKKPTTSTVKNSPNTNVPAQKTESVKEPFKSRLSADAAEFVPSFAKAPVPQCLPLYSSVQDRLKKHKVNAEPVEPVLQNEKRGGCDMDKFTGSLDERRLNNLIDTLTKDPGQFNDLLDIFIDTLYPYNDDVIVLARAAQLLVDKSIEYPSFRYSAARLCCCIEQLSPHFRASLHLTCQKEFATHKNKTGLLMFVAELYTQLHPENIYGKYLIEAYKQLLEEGSNENLKCVCQALKLTGYALDVYSKELMDQVFELLHSKKSIATGTALSLIQSVIALRDVQWGHNSPTLLTSNSDSDNSYLLDNAHAEFIKADGSGFSAEESEFLAANWVSTEEYYTDLSDPDELCDPEPEMDEEIQKAFKDFVKLSQR